jgi:splicing factor 1
MNIGFMTPYDWKPMKKSRRIYLPEYDNPELNFVSLVIGHRGKTQRILEEKSGCRISVQGRMASRNKRPGQYMDEQTHVLVQAETEKELLKGCEMVQAVLRGESVHTVGGGGSGNFIQAGNELVAVEAILRDFCENCREEGHKAWACPYIYDGIGPKKPSHGIITNVYKGLKCQICGDKRYFIIFLIIYSHPTQDCPEKRMKDLETVMKLNKEYVDFKNELGESEFSGLYQTNEPVLQKGQTNFITAGLDDNTIKKKKNQMTFMIEN